MRVLLLGAGGMLGRDMRLETPPEHEVVARTHEELDIRDAEHVEQTIVETKAEWVINASAFADVDRSETDRDLAFAVNAIAVGELGRIARSRDRKVLHFSTDYVFEGNRDVFYREDDDARPVNFYGLSKLEGEQRLQASRARHVIIRTQWLFGTGGRSFIASLWDRARSQQVTRAADDQFGCCTYARDLARYSWMALERLEGIFHVANRGRVSRYEIARHMFERAGVPHLLSRARSSDFPTIARRPASSALSVEKVERGLGARIPSWHDAVDRFIRSVARPALVALAGAVLTAPIQVHAQQAPAERPVFTRATWLELASAVAGGRAEDDIRLALLLDSLPHPAFSLRPLTPSQLESLLPLSEQRGARRTFPRGRWGASSAWLDATYNTMRPFSENDGPMWSGRGLTIAAGAGLVGAWGPISMALRPEAFWTQNRDYTVADPLTQPGSFSNPYDSAFIDMPKRFGPSTYGRLSAGESQIRIGNRYLAVALSTASQVWGPARVYPLVLGRNAGGFPQAIIESGAPWNIGIGSLHARSTVGRLTSSGYAPPAGVQRQPGDYRLGAGIAFVFVPAPLPNLELGAGRFFHRYWTGPFITSTTLAIPFESFFKKTVSRRPGYEQSADNQIASVFGRLALRNIEIYGEFARDDHSWVLRDLMGEPDHASGYVVGFRAVTAYEQDRRLNVLSFEVLNAKQSHLKRLRDQAPLYTHTGVTEGHTYRGQPLGSPAAFGGSGLDLTFERRRPGGTWAYFLLSERIGQNTEGGSWFGTARGFSGLGIERRVRTGVREIAASLLTQAYWHERIAPNLTLQFSVAHWSRNNLRIP